MPRSPVRLALGSLVVFMALVAACSSSVKDDASTGTSSSGSGTNGSCPAGQFDCGGSCRDVRLDPSNCGSCGAACAEGEVCFEGACALACGAGTTECESGGQALCVDTDFDPAHCGGCGKRCADGEVCSMGVCDVACGGGTTKCGNLCTNTVYDPKNCGGCGQVCFAGANAVAFCGDGKCSSKCGTNFGDCNGNPADGCESTLDTLVNCGACGKTCVLANATSACVASACEIATCSPGWGNCDGKVATGCEVNLASTDQNCGFCGNSCPLNQECKAGVCKPKGLAIQVEGHADVIVDCQKGDWSCQAKAVCEAVTGVSCSHQQYDCYFGNMGSWYPEDGQSGSSNFNFAYAYDINGNYGNICACNQGQMQKYGLAANHQYCGLGMWVRQ